MKHFKRLYFIVVLGFYFCSIPFKANAQIEIGLKLPKVILDQKLGGTLNGEPWDTDTLKNRVWIVFYVDPDKKDENIEFEKSLKNAGFSKDTVSSVGVINYKATWIPDQILTSALESKIKEYPSTLYIRDLQKTLVNKWGLKDDAYNTLVINPKGEVIYYRAGAIDITETQKVLALIRKSLSPANSKSS